MSEWLKIHTERSLNRVLSRLEELFSGNAEAFTIFEKRLKKEWKRLFNILLNLYGSHYDFFYHLEMLILSAAKSWIERPSSLKELDAIREADPLWFQSEKNIGAVLYVDLFSDSISNLHEHITYFRELGLTYLHLMPLYLVPRGDNDGGYAVSSYRAVNPMIGTMDDIAELSSILRKEGISLVLDFVINHTSDEHEWAIKAKEGDIFYQEFYHIFPDRTLPDQYENNLRDIFPSVRKGSFTWHEGIGKWVWTTFNSFQWDLNYFNPEVFRAMSEELLFLANRGVEVLRLDAVPFIWKRLGTNCENQPEAHMIIQAYNAIARIAAPSLLFKSEAIVHPDEVIKYIAPYECQLSYNPLLMALLWESLATREVRLIEYAMRKRHRIPDECSWVNYLRCHDDIGWTFDDEDARHINIDPIGHRKFLNDFYTGQFPGSFARGLPFQFDPDSGDQRISGTLASLAGLEQGLQRKDPLLIEIAIKRIIMLRSIVLSIGGIPLIYLGEEWGILNDYTYFSDSSKAKDSRWIHRTKTKWDDYSKIHDPARIEMRIFNELVRLINIRKKLSAFQDGGMEIFSTENPHLLGYVRQNGGQRVMVVSNFSEHPQTLSENRFRMHGLGYSFYDHITDKTYTAGQGLYLDSYQFFWLETAK
ncbi:MAG: alpha-glucosidase C-terminal domain-containing protein [Desulfobacterales bacterium]|nr:alpha-glucosidase C-terminal domain-containing protein [Desulfobacterales bacterium]